MHLSLDSQRFLTTAVLSLALASLWMLRHGYAGLDGDAQIYAFQALARLHTNLSGDLYLQNVTQDAFTVFSPLYALAIQAMGIETAARVLTLVLVAGFMASTWRLCSRLGDAKTAWWGVACLTYSSAIFGGAGVFSFSEQYLTARLPAELLATVALASHLAGRRLLALALISLAMVFHPLMSLPVLFIIVLLRLPRRAGYALVLAGVAGCAIFAAFSPFRMDPAWLEIVRERSEFLFLQLWSRRDWNVNARLLLFLMTAVLVINDARVRRIGASCLVIGFAGLVVATLAEWIGPSALLLQGQAWRWVWPAGLLSCLLLPATVVSLWRDEFVGRPCAILLLWGWFIPDLIGTTLAVSSLFIWVARKRVASLSAPLSQWSIPVISTVAVAWILHSSWNTTAVAWAAGWTAFGLPKARSIDAVPVAIAAAIAALLWTLLSIDDTRARATAAVFIIVVSVVLARFTLTGRQFETSSSDSDRFADWTQRMPPTSTVFVAPSRDVGAFVWFTLKRPNYLSLNQSAGVVFSRDTALEIKRRSETVRPLVDPTWRVLSNHGRDAAARRAAIRPLTEENLAQVCLDPALDFVIAPEALKIQHTRHAGEDAYKNWNLYACATARQPPA